MASVPYNEVDGQNRSRSEIFATITSNEICNCGLGSISPYDVVWGGVKRGILELDQYGMGKERPLEAYEETLGVCFGDADGILAYAFSVLPNAACRRGVQRDWEVRKCRAVIPHGWHNSDLHHVPRCGEFGIDQKNGRVRVLGVGGASR